MLSATMPMNTFVHDLVRKTAEATSHIMFARSLPLLILLATMGPSTGCLPASSEDAFIGDRSELLCQGVFNLCKGKRASCRVEKDDYISGQFPGARQFMIETPPGSWNVTIAIFLDPKQQPRSPGTDLDVFWYEPGCAEVFHFQLTRDLPGVTCSRRPGATTCSRSNTCSGKPETT